MYERKLGRVASKTLRIIGTMCHASLCVRPATTSVTLQAHSYLFEHFTIAYFLGLTFSTKTGLCRMPFFPSGAHNFGVLVDDGCLPISTPRP